MEKEIPKDTSTPIKKQKKPKKSKKYKKKKKKKQKKKKRKRGDSSAGSDYCPSSMKKKMRSLKAKLKREKAKETKIIFVPDQRPKRSKTKQKKFK